MESASKKQMQSHDSAESASKRQKLSHDGADDAISTSPGSTRSANDDGEQKRESDDAPNGARSTSGGPSPPRMTAPAPVVPRGTETSLLPLSMQLMRPFWTVCCASCSLPPSERTGGQRGDGLRVPRPLPLGNGVGEAGRGTVGGSGELARGTAEDPRSREITNGAAAAANSSSSGGADAMTHVPSPQLTPLLPGQNDGSTVERLMHQYISACHLYGCSDRINAGVLTTIRFSLPTLRASGSFHDADMLALCELLLPHCNGSLRHVRRLDFSIASKEGRLHGKRGFRSHGAFTLSKVLQQSTYIEEVFLQRNRVGPYGSSAIFLAASANPHLRTLVMRRCQIGERGALAFADYVCESRVSGLREIDMSVNGIGFKGSVAVETALARREEGRKIECDLEGNLVFQEVMNCVTHGLGILLCIIGFFALSHRVRDKSHRHYVSCAVYSCSLLVLYTSSTLYHSFFALQVTRYVFEAIDKCAIYILIAGSYTPYLQIALGDKPIWSVYLLAFIWICCTCGIFVEVFYPTWKNKGTFALAMYLGMGWACMICMPDLVKVLPPGAINLLVLGGVGYTSGVPFFVRNNNLDHSIWHCFVLAGSMFHWFGVYSYVALFF